MRSITAALAGALLLAVVPVPPGLAGQELPVRIAPAPDTAPRDEPTNECPGETPEGEAPSDAERDEARQLARGATEAALLGDPEEALDLLRRATERDPSAADLAYRRARAHDELDETDSAVRWYCRYLALTPGSEDDPEVRTRLDQLREAPEPAAPAPALRHVREGVELLRRGSLEEAERRFTEALRSDSNLAEALYNRGLARGAVGHSGSAAGDLRAYLEVRPDAPDRERVEEAIRFLEDPPVEYDPTRALLLGAVIPGAGHFYTGEPLVGSLLLGVAAAAGLTGAFYERIQVTCLGTPRDGVCPEDQVQSTTTERPALRPGLVTVALAAGVSAVTAHLRAVSRNEETSRLRIAEPEGVAERGAVRLLAPAMAPAPSRGGVAVEIVRLRF